MNLKRIALTDRDGTPRNPECRDGRCPSVFKTEEGDFLVQGFILTAEQRAMLDIPADEQAVRVPRTLLEQLKGKI